MSDKPRHPMQPIVEDKDGVLRFKANPIVQFLLDSSRYDLNQLAMMPWKCEDREQLAMLIGYSVDGFQDLQYVSDGRVKEIENFLEVRRQFKEAT